MAELRAGGMAIIIGLKRDTHLNGKCVVLQQFVKYLDEFISPVNDRIWIHDDLRNAWVVTGDVTHPGGEYGWGSLSPANLMPINGDDFSSEGERHKEREYE